MPHGLTRREFLRYAAATAGALWLSSLAGNLAHAVASQQVNVPTPSFAALPLPALPGAPADVSIGVDGVYWITTDTGQPASYDPVAGAWLPFGGGVDAAAYIPFVDSNDNFSVSLCFFRGPEVYKSGDPAPVPIAQLWPALPPSFRQGIHGAAYMSGNSFYLYCQGQAAYVDVWGQVTVFALTELIGAGWPGGPWQDGLFDYVIGGRDDTSNAEVIFVRNGEYIAVSLYQSDVLAAPQPLSALFGGSALQLLAQGGLDAVLCSGPVQATDTPLQVFSGPLVYALPSTQTSTPAQADYLAKAFTPWPVAWHPVLAQAPCGSRAALWGLTSAGIPIVNDTTRWNPVALPGNTPAVALDSGSDGSVCAISASALFQASAGGGWTQIAAPGFAPQGVSVGDAGHIWVLDAQGNVHRFENGAFAQVNLGVTATDIKASADGTLWHCSAGQATAYRYITEGQLLSEAIPVGLNVSSVQKTTAATFGIALFLAQQNSQPAILRYTSPYLFKTSASYAALPMQRMAVGGASIFLTAVDPANSAQVFTCALDVQTGAESWRYPYPSGSNNIFGFAPLYDPQQQLLYVFQYGGSIDALDAHTGALRWSLPLNQQVIPVQPILSEGTIYVAATEDPNVSPFSTMLYLIAIDAGDAASRAAAGQPVQARWISSINVAGQSPMLPMPPLYFEGVVYQSAWSQWEQQLQINVVQVDPATGAATTLLIDAVGPWPALSPPVVAPMITRLLQPPQYSELAPALVFSTGQSIFGSFLNGNPYVPTYAPPNLTAYPSYTNLVLFDGVIYFADGFGNLYGLDAGMNPVANTPVQLVNGTVYAPLTATAAADGSAVIIASDALNNQLIFFSPGSGNTVTLPTNQTGFMAVSEVTVDNLLYGGGAGTTSSLGQVFGIRTDAISALRDFAIESQMMQDYDPGAVATPRYQTHITIVDEQKTPQPYTGVKIWADEPVTLLVNGQPFAVGPDTPLATHVDAAGSLTLASDASDIFAAPLRLWAAFMDPFERIVIYPDREFHARLPGMGADPANDDPTAINLATGTNYAGTLVFSDQKQAQATAQAVSAVCTATGLGGGAQMLRSSAAPGAAARYTAYDDLPGMAYFPYNTDATRLPVVQNPYGLAWNTGAASYSVLPFAGAAGAIDALTGVPDASLSGPLGSWFSGLWDKIKRGAAKIGQIVVSAGQAIYAGIQYVVDGVTHVLRHVIRDIDDLAALVGAFFVALDKALADVIELLSLLLHFEEVVKTHQILRAALLAKIETLASDISNYGQPALNSFFASGETAIANAFCTIKKNYDASVQCGSTAFTAAAAEGAAIGDLNGAGSTAHTVFRVSPKNGGAPVSHTVYATWGFHKVKSHFQQAQTAKGAAPGDDPFTAFLNTFTSSLSDNPVLQQALSQTKSDFATLFTVTSSVQFLQMAMTALLDICQDLLIGSLAISAAFLDGLLALGSGLITLLFDPNVGLLMQPLDIPVISDLYQALFGNALSFFDLMVLVASIPVTFLYRIIEGAWFSQQAGGQAAGQAVKQIGVGALAVTPLARAMGLMNGSLYFGRLVFMPIADAAGFAGSPNLVLFKLLTGIGVGLQVSAIFAAGSSAGSSTAGWTIYMVGWGLVFAPFLGPAIAPATASFLALARIGAYIFQKADPTVDVSWIAFGGDLMGVFPPFAQPVKYLAETLPITARVLMIAIDVIGNYGAAAVAIAETALNWDAAPTAEPPAPEPLGPARLFIPFVHTRAAEN